MGCGESKQAVATENTLTKSKKKSINNPEKYNNPPVVDKPNNDETNHAKNNDGAHKNAKENEKLEENNEKCDKEKKTVEGEKGVEKKESEVEKRADEPVLEGKSIKDEDELIVKGGEEENVAEKNDDHHGTVEPIVKPEDNVSAHEKEVLKVNEDKEKSSGEDKNSADKNDTANVASTSDVVKAN